MRPWRRRGVPSGPAGPVRGGVATIIAALLAGATGCLLLYGANRTIELAQTGHYLRMTQRELREMADRLRILEEREGTAGDMLDHCLDELELVEEGCYEDGEPVEDDAGDASIDAGPADADAGSATDAGFDSSVSTIREHRRTR